MTFALWAGISRQIDFKLGQRQFFSFANRTFHNLVSSSARAKRTKRKVAKNWYQLENKTAAPITEAAERSRR